MASFLRFYHLPEYMTFLGDEGRDALVVKGILINHHFPLLGPPTSVGNIYLGPLYYYMMAISMAIFWLNPAAAAGMVALLGLATVGLIYYLSREWFGKLPAAIAAFLYAISPVVIVYSRSSWNPNPAPFFTLLAILGLYKSHKTLDFRWLILTGAAAAAVVQMHYLALIMLPILAVLWVYELFRQRFIGLKFRYFKVGSVVGIVLFLLLLSPLVLFDLRHNFMNYKAISTFFLNRQTTVNLNPVNTLERIWPIYSHDLIDRYIAGDNYLLVFAIAVFVLLPILVALWQAVRVKKIRWVNLVLAIWLLGGMGGLALYKQTIYDHYLGFLSPVLFLLIGSFVNFFRKKWQWLIGGILVILLAVINLQHSPLLLPPNNQLERTQQIAKFVIGQSQGQPFNFALISAHNYDAAYQFYLDIYGHKPRQVPFEVTDQLFVVCEDTICLPVGHPKYEIAAFGWTTVASEKDFAGVKVFKLIHNPAENTKPSPEKQNGKTS
ncbi:MAG: glycosyltransferase family 39 protein [Patescibacteria group bacterium]|nr:glycosyltransferase family 39 protein [Patescibacteria group bacterium]